MTSSDNDRLQRLLTYVEADPANTRLLIDTVDLALQAGALDHAATLNDRLFELMPGQFEPQYFAGLHAMHRGDFHEAVHIFDMLFEKHSYYANLRFNLAWSRAMLGDKDAALTLLDTRTVESIAAAAMLKVQLLHEVGELDEALAIGRVMLIEHPDDSGLLSAMATLALDVEDVELARSCAAGGGDHPEALAAAGLLELQDGDIVAARQRFNRSLAIRDHNPRAWIGRGMTALIERDAAGAAHDMDRGAEQFVDHIGSWIAAGWSHLLAGDLTAARQRFEHALTIDPTFAETQGSLAVVAAVSGDHDLARHAMTTALRLDRECFSAALAQSLLLGNESGKAQQIVEQAMNISLNKRGMTVASFMTGLIKPTLH